MPSLNFKSSKGFGVIEIVVAVVVIALLAGGVYIYYQNQSENSSGLTTQEQKELAAACKVEIDDDLLCKVFSNWGSLSSEPYTATTTTGIGTDQESKMVIKSKGDDYHSIMNYDGQTMESMSVDGVTYMKMDGQWYRQEPMELDDSMDDLEDSDLTNEVDSVFEEDKAAKTKYQRLGNESCGGITCIKYEIYTEDEPSDKMYVWVDEKEARVMRFQSIDEDGASYDMVYEYGDVSIVAPADAKDMSEMMMGF